MVDFFCDCDCDCDVLCCVVSCRVVYQILFPLLKAFSIDTSFPTRNLYISPHSTVIGSLVDDGRTNDGIESESLSLVEY